MNDINRKIAVAMGWFEPYMSEWGYETFRALKDIPWKSGEGSFAKGGDISNPEVLCPDWEHDLNAAMPLFIDLPEPSAIEIDRIINSWHIVFDVENQYHIIYGESNDLSSQALATAICEAWLQWKGIEDG